MVSGGEIPEVEVSDLCYISQVWLHKHSSMQWAGADPGFWTRGT